MDNPEFQAQTQRIDELVQRVSGLKDTDARTAALELLQSTMDLHGSVMARIVELLSESGEAGRSSLNKLGSDPLVCGLLVLYGIHPLTMEERVNRALERLRPQLQKQGATLELAGIMDGAVRLQVRNQSQGSPEKLKLSIEQSVLEAVPEAAGIIVGGLSSSDFIPLNMIQPAIKEVKTYEKSPARHRRSYARNQTRRRVDL
jgi:Fe-S cluster biogenesis protein NfuA